jgi:hypothetical protein
MRFIKVIVLIVMVSCSFIAKERNEEVEQLRQEKSFFYLPLLEYKSLFDCSKEKLNTNEYENLNKSQKLLFELFQEVPDLKYEYEEKNKKLDLEIDLPYLKSTLIGETDSSNINNFIRENYSKSESLVLKNKNYSQSYNSAIESKLNFESVFMAKPIEYKTKFDEKINGYKYIIAEHFYSKDYEGFLIECSSSYISIIRSKTNKIKVTNYESFLNLTREALGKTEYDVSEDKVSVLYPHLEIEATSPKKLLEGIRILTQKKEYLDFGESIIKTNIILDSGGLKSTKSEYVDSKILVVDAKEFAIDNDFLICLLDKELALVNAVYIKKSMFVNDINENKDK